MADGMTDSAAKEGREECLEALYRLERTQRRTSLDSLRGNPDMTGIDIPTTVLDLIERGDVGVEGHEILLKRSGRTIGKRIYQRHEIAERFLKLLGLKSERAHREACRLEHIVSLPGEQLSGISETDELSLISELLSKGAVPLARAVRGVRYRIAMVCGGRGARRKLEDMGVSKGAEVILCTRHGGGPVEITVRGSRLALGRGIASKVLVIGASAPEETFPSLERRLHRVGRFHHSRRGW
ncbi:MAG TPA: metal-dependent transcriptional regulator [Spirochaetia bacterium]|nr:metal-dependent transcriptional regulator [Spirochaetia bacterium]